MHAHASCSQHVHCWLQPNMFAACSGCKIAADAAAANLETKAGMYPDVALWLQLTVQATCSTAVKFKALPLASPRAGFTSIM
jgi:hypothetical protein